MAKHSIQIQGVADFSSISKEIKELNNVIESTFGKKGLKVIDESSLSFLKKQANSTLSQMQSQLKKLKDEARALDGELKSVTQSDAKSEELSRKRLENLKKITQAEKEIKSLSKGAATINYGGKNPEEQKASFGKLAGGQIAGGIKGVAGQLPGGNEAGTVVGGATGAAQAGMGAGLGMGAIAGLGLLGVAAGVAAVAVSRAAAGFEVFKQAIPNLLSLTATGITPIRGGRARDSAAELGFSQLDVLDTQKGLGSAFGRSKDQRSEENRLMNTMTASRGLGISPGQITGAGEQLRQVGGTEQAQKQMAVILEKAFTSGMNKTQATHYLASATQLLTDLNQSGVMNSDRLLSTMSGLVAKGNMSPEQAARSLKGINSAISESSGENNAFFQSAAARGGLGGGSILGTQFAVRQGLQGVDMGALDKQVGDTKGGRMGIQSIKEMGLGDKDFTQKFATSILGELNRRVNTDSKEGRQAALGLVGQTFGVKTAPEAAKVLALLEKISKGGGNESDKKVLEALTKDPEESWRKDVLSKLDPIAQATTAIAARSENAKFDLGQASAPIFNKLTEAVTALDNDIKAFLEKSGLDKGQTSFLDSAQNIAKMIWTAITDAFQAVGKMFANFGEMIAAPIRGALGMDDRGVIGVGEDLGRKAINGISNMLGMGDAVAPSGGNQKLTDEEVASFGAMDGPAKGGKSGSAPAGSAAASGQEHGVSDVVQQQRETNNLLKQMMRSPTAPRSNREPLKAR